MAVVAVKGSPNVYPVRSRTPNSRPSSQHFMTTPNQERRPRSLRSKSYNQSRASSAHSAISAAETTTSHGTRLSRRSASPATSSHSRRRHRREITKEHLHALAALTAPAPRPDGNMTAESIAFFDAQQKKLDEKRRRESVASERAMRISLIEQENRSRATSRTRSIYHYRPPTASSNGVPTMPEPSMTHSATIEDTDEATMANESIRLLREREKLVRWKAEREKVDFERKQRDKIRERVRRANEMEEERSKALEKQQHKKKKRGWCGSRRE
ncbi:hypothetical protein P154DRAFT_518818 [Amniculicola lignicola CBS 123094]|uniref:Uncharacterized protein n=1 Tax=Amniculicola lignicola CBS 123094 TaxID=1392246 RepID=A0A6A5WWG6_9PLEO|nr:hypothetical protein P154DRAFT_518818 [Amniculicola lignicola CBS 123094]